MKRLVLAILAATLCLAAGAAQPTIKVKNVPDLLKAIGPARTIELAAGTYDLSAAKQLKSKYLSWTAQGGTPELTIVGVDGLTISGEGAELLVTSPSIHVLVFKDCSNLRLEGLKLGHRTQEPCMEGVLLLTGTSDSSIESCELYGSGALGIELQASRNVAVNGGVIRDCTSGAIRIEGSQDVTVQGLEVRDNQGGYPLIGVYGSAGTYFSDCYFTGNQGYEFLAGDADTSDFSFEYCDFSDNSFEVLSEEEPPATFFEVSYGGNSFDGELDGLVGYADEGGAGLEYAEIEGSGLAISWPGWLNFDDSDPSAPFLYENEPESGAVRVGRVYELRSGEDPDTQAESILKGAVPRAERWLAQAGVHLTKLEPAEPVNTEAPPYHYEYYAEGTSAGGKVSVRIKLVQGDGAVWCFAAYDADPELLAPGSTYGIILDDVVQVDSGD